MATYFVEGKIIIDISVDEIEANSLEEAQEKTFNMFKNEHPMGYYANVNTNHSLSGGEYLDEEY